MSAVYLIWLLHDSGLTRSRGNTVGMWLLYCSQHGAGTALAGKRKGCNRNAAKLGRRQSSVAKCEQRNGNTEMEGNINCKYTREKILEGEDSYCLQILEMQILTMRMLFFSFGFFFFLIEKNVCRKNEVGKWKKELTNASNTVKDVGLWHHIPVARVGIVNLSYLAFLSGQICRKLRNGKILHWPIG